MREDPETSKCYTHNKKTHGPNPTEKAIWVKQSHIWHQNYQVHTTTLSLTTIFLRAVLLPYLGK